MKKLMATNQMNRSENAKRNIFFGIINKIVTLFFPFVMRMVIIRKFGSEYLGLNSLFSSILQVLNLTELGFGSAIIYSMYKPIAENDIDTLCAILKFYRKIYFIIGFIFLTLGGIVLPFLPKLINGEYPADINIYILYIIYLINTFLSYVFFAYKNSLLAAYQREDIRSRINTYVSIVVYLLQITIIFLTKNYYLYIFVNIISTIISNLCTQIVSYKIFPQIVTYGTLKKEIRSEIIVKVKGLLLQNLCATSRNAFDSIFISAFLGLTETAIYNNYYYIMNSVISILNILSSSIQAGVGNSIVLETQQKNYEDMKKFNFLYMWVSGWCTVCLLCLYQPFTKIFFGLDMTFSTGVILLFCLYFYTLKMGDIRAIYNSAKGLWWEGRYRAIVEALANLILNFILGKHFGVYGIVSATWISLFIFNFLWGTTILYKYYFTEIRISQYYLYHLLYALVTMICCCVTYIICNFISLNGFIELIIKAFICLVIPNIIYIVIYRRSKLFINAIEWISSILGIKWLVRIAKK